MFKSHWPDCAARVVVYYASICRCIHHGYMYYMYINIITRYVEECPYCALVNRYIRRGIVLNYHIAAAGLLGHDHAHALLIGAEQHEPRCHDACGAPLSRSAAICLCPVPLPAHF